MTQEIEQRLQPYDEAARLLQTIPGVKEAAAATIVAEIGVDRTRFPSAGHLASWAGVCPGNKQSGGKRMAETTTKGSPWLRAMLRAMLGEIAWSIHTRDNYLAAQYRRLSKRLGPHKAAIAVAHSVLVVIYHLLRNHTPYTDLGADYFDRVDAVRLEQHHVRRLEHLGYTVTLTPSATV